MFYVIDRQTHWLSRIDGTSQVSNIDFVHDPTQLPKSCKLLGRNICCVTNYMNKNNSWNSTLPICSLRESSKVCPPLVNDSRNRSNLMLSVATSYLVLVKTICERLAPIIWRPCNSCVGLQWGVWMGVIEQRRGAVRCRHIVRQQRSLCQSIVVAINLLLKLWLEKFKLIENP